MRTTIHGGYIFSFNGKEHRILRDGTVVDRFDHSHRPGLVALTMRYHMK